MTTFQQKNNWDKGYSDTHSIYSGTSNKSGASKSRSANRGGEGESNFGIWGKKTNAKNRESSPVFGSQMGQSE